MDQISTRISHLVCDYLMYSSGVKAGSWPISDCQLPGIPKIKEPQILHVPIQARI